ncbi:hypothetical protein VTN00DRAFT_7101 [Thermoascus crustaceus]|uniref:uncharacterized protein n=1 Tax=Thermoascus crustaceus TaxID=5088 RepID=UPI0037441908
MSLLRDEKPEACITPVSGQPRHRQAAEAISDPQAENQFGRATMMKLDLERSVNLELGNTRSPTLLYLLYAGSCDSLELEILSIDKPFLVKLGCC